MKISNTWQPYNFVFSLKHASFTLRKLEKNSLPSVFCHTNTVLKVSNMWQPSFFTLNPPSFILSNPKYIAINHFSPHYVSVTEFRCNRSILQLYLNKVNIRKILSLSLSKQAGHTVYVYYTIKYILYIRTLYYILVYEYFNCTMRGPNFSKLLCWIAELLYAK